MRTLCLLFSCLALLAAACGGANEKEGSGSENDKQPPAILDLQLGSFGGVALGDTVEKMQRVFGPKDPAAEGEPATALSIGDGQDYSPPVLGPGADAFYRYDQVVFMVGRSRIGAIIVNDPDGRVGDAGPNIGDELKRAQSRYDLRCGTANEGTEYEPFPACVGRTAPRVYVWFGGDPIRNITLSRARPDGV